LNLSKLKQNSSYNNKNAQLMYGNNLEQKTNRQVIVYTIICAFTCVSHFFCCGKDLEVDASIGELDITTGFSFSAYFCSGSLKE
jgi:hypothetical protein